MSYLTIEENVLLLQITLNDLVSFDNEQEKTDFILDVVNEYRDQLKGYQYLKRQGLISLKEIKK